MASTTGLSSANSRDSRTKVSGASWVDSSLSIAWWRVINASSLCLGSMSSAMPFHRAIGIGASGGVCQWYREPEPTREQPKEKEMPKIRHLAIICMDPEKLAKFYSEVFEMKIVARNGRNN